MKHLSALAVTMLFIVAGVALGASPSQASGQTLNYTIDCAHSISVTADVGDTLIFTMTHPGCDGDPYWAHPGANYANFNSLNGTYFNGLGSAYVGTATGSGFLDYVSHTQGTAKSTDYWFNHGGQDDWYVMQTASSASTTSVVITTTLRATDGNGTALAVGSTIADIFTEPALNTAVEFAVTYAGPRTVSTPTPSVSPSASSSPSSTASPSASAETLTSSSTALADTGSNNAVQISLAVMAGFALLIGVILFYLRKRSRNG